MAERLQRARLGVACLFGGLVACAPLPPESPPRPGNLPAGFPVARYLDAIARGEAAYLVEPAASLAVATVRRGGPLAKLGHDHVVASHGLNGYVLPAAGEGDLYVPLADLDVDEPELREAAGLDTRPSAADIVGTKKNLQEKVLDTARHPFALVHLRRSGADALEVTLTLNGVAHTYTVPARLETRGEELVAEGSFAIRQSDFGITPFAVLGGGLTVEDALVLRFAVKAHRIAE